MSILQNGTVSPRHLVSWTTTGVVQDAGSSATPGVSSLGLFGNGGTPFSITNSAVPGAPVGIYSQLNAGVSSTAAYINVDTFGTTALPLDFNINGSPVLSLGASGPTFSAPVPVASGGTGLSATPTNGQLLIGNGTGYSLNTLTAGANIAIANTAGSVTISAVSGGGVLPALNGGTGVTSTSAMPVTAAGSTTARTLAARFAERFDVFDYGAAGNGTTDDTAAINAAIAACQTAGGGTVWFPGAHTYLVTGTLAITGNGVCLLGAGSQNTVINFQNGTSDCITVEGPSYASQITGFQMSGFRLNFTGKTGGRTVVLANLTASILSDVYIYNCWTGIEIWNINNLLLDYVTIQGVTGGSGSPTYFGTAAPGACYGLFFHSPGDSSGRSDQLTTRSVVVNAGFSGADGFIWDGNASTWNMFATTALSCRYGLRIKNSSASGSYFPQFLEAQNFVTDGMSQCGLYITGGSFMQFNNCVITNTSGESGQGSADISAVYIGSDVPNSYTNTIQFTGCVIGNCKQSGAVVYARDVQFIGCTFYSGNTTPTNTYGGVDLVAPAQDIIVSGCKFRTWGAAVLWEFGVRVGASTNRILISGNLFYGATYRSIIWNNTDSISFCNGNVSDLPGGNGPSSNVVTSGVTITAAWIWGGALNLTGPAAAWTATTDSAANIVAACINPNYNHFQSLLFINTSAYQVTLSPGSGVSFAGITSSGNFVIPANTQKTLLINITNPAIGSEAVTIYG